MKHFKNIVNNGFSFAGITVNLKTDIDISGISWEPIGNLKTPFVGTFNGNGHTIKGLNNGTYTASADLYTTTATAENYGSAYGFFGIIGVDDKDVTIKNLKLSEVNINSGSMNMVGALVGADLGTINPSTEELKALHTTHKVAKRVSDLTQGYNDYFYCGGKISISNVTVSGSIKSTNSTGGTVGGIVGKSYNSNSLTIISCENNVNIICNKATGDLKVGGIVGYVKYGKVTIDSCTNKGDITLDEDKGNIYIGGLAAGCDDGHLPTNVALPEGVYDNFLNVTIKDSTSEGDITITNHDTSKKSYLSEYVSNYVPNGSYSINNCTISGCTMSYNETTLNTAAKAFFTNGQNETQGCPFGSYTGKIYIDGVDQSQK